MFDIRELFLFTGLSEEAREAIIASLGKPEDFQKGDVIYDAAHFSHALGVFLSGRGIAGSKRATRTAFSAGDVFGAASLFGAGEAYVSRVTATAASRVLFISEDELRVIFEAHPACAVNYIGFLSGRVRYLNRKIAQYTGEDAAARLWRLLSDQADETGQVKNVNVSLLGRLASLGRTSVYRALGELEASGAISREGKNIRILGDDKK